TAALLLQGAADRRPGARDLGGVVGPVVQPDRVVDHLGVDAQLVQAPVGVPGAPVGGLLERHAGDEVQGVVVVVVPVAGRGHTGAGREVDAHAAQLLGVHQGVVCRPLLGAGLAPHVGQGRAAALHGEAGEDLAECVGRVAAGD